MKKEKFNLEKHIEKFEEQKPSIPISSNEKYLKNKSINYNIYLKLLYLSNFDKDKILDFMVEFEGKEKSRFLYRNKLTDNKEATEKFFDKNIQTIDRNLNTLEQMGLIEKLRAKGKRVYVIYYSTNKRKFVRLSSRATTTLLNYDSNTIKIYVLLKYMCKDVEKQITREYIAENIGLSSRSKKTLQMITNSLASLQNEGLIKIRTVSDGKKKYNYYKVK